LKESAKGLHICLLTSARVFEIGYGGNEKFTTSLGRFLIMQDYTVTLLASGFANVKSKRLSRYNVDEQETKKAEKKIRILNPPYAIYALSRFIMSILWVLKIFMINRKRPITLIHAQDTGYSGLAAVISGKILAIPVVISSHGIRHKVIESYIKGKFKNLLLKNEYKLDIFTIKHADVVIVPNRSIKDYFEQRTSVKIDFIPIPINVKKFEFSETNRYQIRRELQLDEKTKVIGFIGRLVPVKNLITLLTAFANVADDDPTIKLVLVGTGQLDLQLREFANKRNIENKVIFCGIRYDTYKILAAFDMFVLASYTEGLSTALLEAMACGRAIICSDIPANHQVVGHNEDALIFDPYNIQELEGCIRLLSHDESLRSRLGANARKRAIQYDEGILFPKILQCYEALSK
jgi:glycosyltransferase involved in cell wall biosynthesis